MLDESQKLGIYIGMSLLLQKLIQELPENDYNINKTAKKIGYSDSYAKSGLYASIRNCKKIKQYFTEDTVKRDIAKVKKIAFKEKDLTNILRASELQSKILGMQVDKSEVTNKNPDKIVIAYGTAPSKSE